MSSQTYACMIVAPLTFQIDSELLLGDYSSLRVIGALDRNFRESLTYQEDALFNGDN